MRSREWKLVEGLGSGGFTPPAHIEPRPGQPDVQLYNLQTDREEETNVAAAHPQIVRGLRAKLRQIQSEGRSRPRSPAD